jgi:hypothetical protein
MHVAENAPGAQEIVEYLVFGRVVEPTEDIIQDGDFPSSIDRTSKSLGDISVKEGAD